MLRIRGAFQTNQTNELCETEKRKGGSEPTETIANVEAILSYDEGLNLSEVYKSCLAALLTQYNDVLSARNEPTRYAVHSIRLSDED